MKRFVFIPIVLCIGLCIGIISCGDDDNKGSGGDSDTDTDGDADGDADGDSDVDTSFDAGGDSSIPHEECRTGEDCASGYCESYWTAPPDPNAFCDTALEQGEIRILGNTRDFETMEIMPHLEIDIIGGPAALQDPVDALALESVTSDENGLFALNVGQMVTKEPMAIGVRVNLDGYYLSLTGLCEPEIEGVMYPPGVRNHDIWAVPKSMVDDWTAIMMEDPLLKNFAPLGVMGGVFGRVRDADTGLPPKAPVELRSQYPDSQAIVRYLNEDGTGFIDGGTGPSGLYLILNAVLAEKFDAYRGDKLVSIHECTVGSGFSAVGITTIQIDEDWQ
ncbi:MAG: hypothetical protein GY854_29470 [Deltaproteobacteria bacterium]|nr:hypothetical protein [Deltaproteobacteria bacterium]